MSHEAQQRYIEGVREAYPEHFGNAKVLEVGSLNINGTVRILFRDCSYLGIDIGPGPDVDRVCHLCDLERSPHDLYDTVISCEALEHDRRWSESLRRMYDLLVPGGLLVVTCAGPGRPQHGTHYHDPSSSPHTLDWYDNISEQQVREALCDCEFRKLQFDCITNDTRFYGIRG